MCFAMTDQGHKEKHIGLMKSYHSRLLELH